MKRLTWGAWIGSIGLLAVPWSVLEGQTPPGGAGSGAEVRPSRPRSAVETGIDYHLKGEYETAEAILGEAEKYQQYLSPEEKSRLVEYKKRNVEALGGRRMALQQLVQADEAVRMGNTRQADALLKSLRASKYLNAQERQQVAMLGEQFKQKGGSGRRGTPDGMLKDAKPDADGMLAEARRALERGEVDQAEMLAREAETAGFSSVFPWSDNPSKVLKDAQAARAKLTPRVASGPAPMAPMAPTQPPASTPDAKTTQARELLAQARAAAQAGDTATARKLVAQAEALKANIPWWDENSADKVKQEIVKAEQARNVRPALANGNPAPTAPTTPAAPTMTADAMPQGKMQPSEVKSLIKQARQACDRNDYDRAEMMAKQARQQTGVKYGLFEDTPDKVLADVLKNRDSGKDDKAAAILAESRRKMEAGQYDEAEKLTYQAEAMKSSYPIWHRGERHDKLRTEIVAKRKSTTKTTLPPLLDPVATRPATTPAKPSGLASVTPNVPMPRIGGAPSGPPSFAGQPAQPSMDPKKQQALQTLAEARQSLNRGEYPNALQLAAQAQMSGVEFGPGEDSPQAIVSAVKAVQASKTDRQNPAAAEAAKKQAKQLLADARLLQKDGRLIEAQQCAQQAKKIGVAYGPGEENPEVVLAELRKACDTQMKTYTTAANTLVERGQYTEAERYWRYVFQLGNTYGMDTTAVGMEIAKVQKMSAGTASVASGPIGEAEELLAQAEKELTRGDLVKARNFANMLYTGPFNMKNQARDVLARIDDADHKSLVRRTHTAYDLGLKAYYRKDYAVAASYFQSIDLRLLEDDKRAHAQEVLSSKEMQAPSEVRVAKNTEDDDPTAGKASVGDQPRPITDPPKPTMVDEVRKRQALEFQRLRQEALQSQQQANKMAGAGDLDGAVEALQTAIAAVKASSLDPDQAGPLLRQLDDRNKKFSIMREQVAFQKLNQSKMANRLEDKQKDILFHESKKEQVSDFMKKYANYMKEGKYSDAYVMAMKAHELDPDSPATEIAMFKANVLRNQSDEKAILAMTASGASAVWRDVGRAGAPNVDDTHPISYGENFKELTKHRGKQKYFQVQPVTPMDREVTNKLNTVVSVDFKNKPLVEVLNELRSLTNVNIVPDQPFIEADNISLDQPVSIRLDSLPLKTILTRLLHNAKLTYAVRDGVLLVTTPAGQRGKLVQVVHPVADLVSATDRFNPTDASAVSVNGIKSTAEGLAHASANFQWATNGGATGSYDPLSPGKTGAPTPHGKPQRRPGQSMEELLMRLIKDTIEPASWDEMGGSGHIDYYPLGMSLIISQTPDIQEQIQQLLERLRELQDLQVTVEVRFITLTEEFYERIGVDFDIELNDKQTRFDRMVASNTFAPQGLLNEPDHLDNVIIGLTPQGNFTSDLDIPINSSSFNLATPPFGGFPNSPGSNGGLDLGVAFLSSIEVYLFMEAAQGDRRSNVLTAPKVTLFNGQTANLTSSTEQFFVTQVIPITNPFTGFTTFLPVNTPFPTSVTLTVQAVVTADRRYVQLTLNPFITRTRAGGTFQPVPGITLQQPTIDILSVGTTVSVPDGGTILMGGLKTMSEGRNEFGPPILSKIPYINRLFRNSGYGRESTSLMIMVTPRIIIPEEEEERLGNTFAF